jgi:hypothetical protein
VPGDPRQHKRCYGFVVFGQFAFGDMVIVIPATTSAPTRAGIRSPSFVEPLTRIPAAAVSYTRGTQAVRGNKQASTGIYVMWV